MICIILYVQCKIPADLISKWNTRERIVLILFNLLIFFIMVIMDFYGFTRIRRVQRILFVDQSNKVFEFYYI